MSVPAEVRSAWYYARNRQKLGPRNPFRHANSLPASRDLETICLKCLLKEPEKRYGSAGEMADDLKRFRAGEPIKARPVGRLARTWRWSRRNPVLATVTLLLLLVFAGGVSGIVWQWRQAVENFDEKEYQRGEAEKNAQQEREQRERAEEGALANLRYVYASRMSQVPQDWEYGDVAAVHRHLELCSANGAIETYGAAEDWDRGEIKLLHRVVAHPEGIYRFAQLDGEL